MQVNFVAPNHDLIFSGGLPEKLKSHALPEATREVAGGLFGYLVFQQLATPTFAVRYHCYFLNETNKLEIASDAAVLELLFNLDAPLDLHLEGLGNLLFEKNAYNLMYAPFLKGTLSFQKDQTYRSFSIRFDVNYLDTFVRYFPELAELQQKIKAQQPGILYKVNPVAPRELLSNIKDILQCNYSDKLLKLFLDAKLITILLLGFENNATRRRSTAKLRRADIVQIENVRQLLLENLHKQYRLSELAATAGISETKLPKGFMMIVGKTWFTFQLQARMEKAKELLLSTEDPANDIGIEVGYQAIDSFSKAFKQHYGLSPTQYRKKYNLDRNN